MSLQLGSAATDFEAQSTDGDFHDWIGDSRAALFSHPRSRQTSTYATL